VRDELLEKAKKIRCSEDDCGGQNCKHIRFQIIQVLAAERLATLELPEIVNIKRLLESFAEKWDETEGNETPMQIICRIERNSEEALSELKTLKQKLKEEADEKAR